MVRFTLTSAETNDSNAIVACTRHSAASDVAADKALLRPRARCPIHSGRQRAAFAIERMNMRSSGSVVNVRMRGPDGLRGPYE